MRYIALMVLVCSFGQTAVRAQPDVAAGQRAFELCAGCHGFVGEGNSLVGAPRLAGIEPWYTERQMRNFSGMIRGHVDGDDNGRRMALIAQAVDTQRRLQDLVGYIASLPAGDPPSATVSGDVAAGRNAYAVCAACHGADAQGNEALGAPGLTALDDWYLVEQLRLYADGKRGVHQADIYGQQMRALSSAFSDPAVQLDLAAYVNSL